MSKHYSNPIVESDLSEIAESGLDWDQFAGKTIAVTGAGGFLPAFMVETLLFLNKKINLQCNVFGLVRSIDKAQKKYYCYLDRDDFHLVIGDVSQKIQWPCRCDVIVHAASLASPIYYGKDPVGTMTANITGTYHLLNQAREWGVDSFLFFSSGEVYGQVPVDKVPTKESDYGYIDIANSRSCYAESKRAAETLGISYAKQFAIPFKIVRPFHTYGPGMALDDGRVFADFVSDVVHQRNLIIRGNGNAVRAFCYISDAIRGFFTVLLKGENATPYNVGNPFGALKISELANLLVELFPDKKLKVEFCHKNIESYFPSPISINVPNVDRLMELGWSPTYSPQEGFLRTIKSFGG